MTKNHKKKRKTNNLWLIDIQVNEIIIEEVTRTPETTNIDDHEEKILSWNKKKSQELANEANAYWWKKMYLARLRNSGATSS